ncbi:IS982 family transposase [Rickettsia endosymbiont of Oedothorax gibbosus]|uniref:IS982 family transposase n=1 Tax=Rickettsia endosymbiont of Oedothorax gibbosus TaxID=931099 RepID=UPI00397E5D48
MIPLTEIFCLIDDFCKHFDTEQNKYILPNPNRKRKVVCSIGLSEIITIIVMFHLSHYRTFKDFYLCCLCQSYRKEFPKLVSYSRFVQLMPMSFMPMVLLLKSLSGKQTGQYYIDSTKLPACHNLRINRHKVFKDIAKRGKTSTGWFFGCKLHIVINSCGEIMSFSLTPGNVDDRAVVENLVDKLQGWLFGDRGYISKKLTQSLANQGLELITKIKSNMKERIIDPIKKRLLNKRYIIETINDQLKNLCHIDHTRHRSVMNFQTNVLAGLLAYVFRPNKISVAFGKLNNLNLPLTSN